MTAWRSILTTAVIFIALHVGAQNTLNVQVVDSASAEPLIGATAIIAGTTIGAAMDLNGRGIITGAPDGRQALQVAMIGYRTKDLVVTFPYSGPLLVVKLASSSTELEMVVVSATRTNSRIEDAPQKIEVLGAEELHEESSLKPNNIASLIGDISSVQLQQTSASSGATTVRMQGLDGRHTLLMRDGMPAFGGLSGGFDLLRIPPLDLQRVELLKGPSSTFNGGGAIAGAINFVSKDPADSLSGMVLVNGTSLQGADVNVYASGPVGRVGFTLFGGSSIQQAVDVNGDGYSDLGNTRTNVIHPQLFVKAGKHTRLRFGGVYQHDARTGGDMKALDATDDTSRYFLRTIGERKAVDVRCESDLGDGSSFTLKGTVSDYTQENRTNFDAGRNGQLNSYAEAFWSNGTQRRTWVFGGSYTGSRLTGDRTPTQSLSTPGLFTQLALHRERWPEIDFGVRTDLPAGYDPIVLPSIAAMYKPRPRLTLRANAGTGYQLPDRSRNYSLVSENGATTSTAAGTREERSYGGTVEWTWKLPLSAETFLFIDQTFFLTSISDPLAVSADADGVNTLHNNSGSTLTRGIDNYIRLTHEPIDLYVGYTYTLPQAMANGQSTIVPYTPLHRAAITLSYELGEHWRVGLEASWSGEQKRFDGTNTHAQYFTAGMLGYRRGPWNVVLNAENITDTRQTRWEPVVSGTLSRPVYAPIWAPLEGRVVNLSVLYHFGRRSGDLYRATVPTRRISALSISNSPERCSALPEAVGQHQL